MDPFKDFLVSDVGLYLGIAFLVMGVGDLAAYWLIATGKIPAARQLMQHKNIFTILLAVAIFFVLMGVYILAHHLG